VCTVSWVHQRDSYHLLCNRDEKRTRGTAFAPQVVERGGIRYIAPIDSDRGGTWLSVNEFGLSVCLLNGTTNLEPSRLCRSRGLLLRELAWAPSAPECAVWLRHQDLSAFAPFSIVMLEPGRPAILSEWSGRELTVDPAGDRHMPLTSSSYDATGVRRARLNQFARCAGAMRPFDPALLYWFHASHGAAPGAYSTCMHREDAETVSFSWVVVSKDEVRFLYSPGAPCQSKPSDQQILARAA